MWSDVAKAFSTGSSFTREYRHGADVFVDCDEAFIHDNAEEEGGGLACSDSELINSQRRIIIDIGKQLGRKLLSGNLNLINISLPVVMFETRSYLQKLADPWVHPIHLEKAAACSNPLERMKLTVTWFVAGLQHVFCSWRKPFNPLLGETWQAHLPSGTRIFTEQVSHHPPVTAFHMDGRAGLYTFDGLSQPQVSFSSGALKTSARGYRRITFAADGAVITIKYPHYRIAGLISGVPRGLIKGTATLTDTKHHITATVSFGPVAGATSRLLARADSLHIAITGPPAAAAAEIKVPQCIEAVAAERSGSAAADGTLVGDNTAAAAAAVAAAALLAPVLQKQPSRAGVKSVGSAFALHAESTTQDMQQSNSRPLQLNNSNQSASSSNCSRSSQDCQMIIDSMHRSNSGNSVINLEWLNKPKKRFGRFGRSPVGSSSRSGSQKKYSRHQNNTPGLRLGSCFGSFQVNPSHVNSSSSSNCVSPCVSRAHSSSASCIPNGSLHMVDSTVPGALPAAKQVCLEASTAGGDSIGVFTGDGQSCAKSDTAANKTALAGDVMQQDDSSRVTHTPVQTAAAAAHKPVAASIQQASSVQQQGCTANDALLSNQPPLAHKQQKQAATASPQKQQGYARQSQQLLATGCGNWLSHLDFDGQRYWTLVDDPPEHWVSLHDCQHQQKLEQQQHDHQHHVDHHQLCQSHHLHHDISYDGNICPLNVLLPSDSQLRADLAAFRSENPRAQQVKEQLEQQQRQDAKLRPHFPHRDCAQAD